MWLHPLPTKDTSRPLPPEVYVTVYQHMYPQCPSGTTTLDYYTRVNILIHFFPIQTFLIGKDIQVELSMGKHLHGQPRLFYTNLLQTNLKHPYPLNKKYGTLFIGDLVLLQAEHTLNMGIFDMYSQSLQCGFSKTTKGAHIRITSPRGPCFPHFSQTLVPTAT